MTSPDQPPAHKPIRATPENTPPPLPQDLGKLAMNRTFKIMSLQNIAHEKNNEPQLVPGVSSIAKNPPMGSFYYPPLLAQRVDKVNTRKLPSRLPKDVLPGLACRERLGTNSPVEVPEPTVAAPMLPRADSHMSTPHASSIRSHTKTIAPWADPRLLFSSEYTPGHGVSAPPLYQPGTAGVHPWSVPVTPPGGPKLGEPGDPRRAISTTQPPTPSYSDHYMTHYLAHCVAHQQGAPGAADAPNPLLSAPSSASEAPMTNQRIGMHDICHPNKSIGNVPRVRQLLTPGPATNYLYPYGGPEFVQHPLTVKSPTEHLPYSHSTHHKDPRLSTDAYNKDGQIRVHVQHGRRIRTAPFPSSPGTDTSQSVVNMKKGIALEEPTVGKDQKLVGEQAVRRVSDVGGHEHRPFPCLPQSAISSMAPVVPRNSDWAQYVLRHGSSQTERELLMTSDGAYRGTPMKAIRKSPAPSASASGLLRQTKTTVTESARTSGRSANPLQGQFKLMDDSADKNITTSRQSKGATALPSTTSPQPESKGAGHVAGPNNQEVIPPRLSFADRQNFTSESWIRRAREVLETREKANGKSHGKKKRDEKRIEECHFDDWFSTVRTDSVRKVQAWLDNIIADEEATEASAITEDGEVVLALEHQLNSELDDETVVAAGDWQVL